MKQLKLRVFDKINSIMKPIGYTESHTCLITDRNDFIEYQSPAIHRSGENVLMEYTNVLMEYTGLNDTNDEEIYEGDILEALLPTLKKPINYEVVFNNGKFEVEIIDKRLWRQKYDLPLLITYGKAKIIGNIFQNPELIKGVYYE